MTLGDQVGPTPLQCLFGKIHFTSAQKKSFLTLALY